MLPAAWPRAGDCPRNGVSGLTRRAGARREGLASDDGDTERCGEEEGHEQSAEQQAAVELVRLAKEQGLSQTGPDGLLKQLTKTVLEAALGEEVTEHLGYEKHDPAGAGTGNIGNGTGGKTVLTEASGLVGIDVPRDRAGT